MALTRKDIVESKLGALLPPPNATSSIPLVNRRDEALFCAFKSSFLRVLVNAVENNFASLDNVPMGTVLNFLKNDDGIRTELIKYLKKTPKKVATAFIEKTMVASIEEQDDVLIEILLSSGLVDPAKVFCWHEGHKCNALQRAADLGSTKTMSVLITASKELRTFGREARNRILLACLKAMAEEERCDIQLIKAVLNCGAEVDVEAVGIAITIRNDELIDLLFSKLRQTPAEVRIKHLCLAIKLKNQDLIEFLIEKLRTQTLRSPRYRSYFDARENELLPCIIENTEDIAAAEIIQRLLILFCAHILYGREVRVGQYKPPQSIKKFMVTAAGKGYLNVVKLFLPLTDEAGPVFAAAIRNRSPDLIQSLITSGANVVGQPFGLPGDIRLTTPLAEAIRARDKKLVSDLEYQAPWNHPDFEAGGPIYGTPSKVLLSLRQCDGFREALHAASEIGDLEHVQKLLDHPLMSRPKVYISNFQDFPSVKYLGSGVQINPRFLLSSSLCISIVNGHRRIAMSLLRAGALVDSLEKLKREND